MTQGSQREKWLRNVLDNLQKSANLWEKFLVSTSLLSLPLSLLRSLKNLCFLILRFCFKLLVFLKTNQKNMVQKWFSYYRNTLSGHGLLRTIFPRMSPPNSRGTGRNGTKEFNEETPTSSSYFVDKTKNERKSKRTLVCHKSKRKKKTVFSNFKTKLGSTICRNISL